MVTISKIAQPMVKNGIASKLKNKAMILAATAALVPAIANAKTNTVKEAEPVQTEAAVTTNEASDSNSSQTYYVYESYPITYEFNAGRAYNMGNQFGVTLGADYGKSETTKLQTLGPYIDIAGKLGGRVNCMFDVKGKVGFDMPEIENKSPNFDAYASAGLGVDIVRGPKTCLTLDVGPEGYVNSCVYKIDKYDNAEGNWGVGGKAGLTFQQGIGHDTRMSLSARGSYGAAGAFYNKGYWHDIGMGSVYKSGSRIGRYAGAAGELKFDIGVLSIGGYINYLNRSADAIAPTESGVVSGDEEGSTVNRDAWGWGAKLGFRFGN